MHESRDVAQYGKPAIIQRAGDTMVLCFTRTLVQLMARVNYMADLYTEADGSMTISMDDMGLVVNAPTEEQAKKALCREIMEYAQELESLLTYRTGEN